MGGATRKAVHDCSVWHVHTCLCVPSMRAGVVAALLTVFQHQGQHLQRAGPSFIGCVERMSADGVFGLLGEEACPLPLLPSNPSCWRRQA